MDAPVGAELAPLFVDDRAATRQRRLASRDEAGVVAVRNETDLLAVGLVGDEKLEPPRLLPDLRLRQRADGEERTGQLLLREREQEVRLILLGIGAAPQFPSP